MKTGEGKRVSNAGKSAASERIWALGAAIKEGRLDSRANLDGVNEEDREILTSVNQIVDSIVRPLNVAAEYVDRISKGDIPPKITDDYNGDFNEIKNNLNNCIDIMNNLLKEADKVVKAAADGSWISGPMPISS